MAVGTTNPVKLYRKETFGSVFTNSESFILKSYKYNLLFTLLHRAFKLCSNFEIFNNVFKSNAYPKSFVDLCIKKYLDHVFITKKVVLKASEKELICVLPFIGNKSPQQRTRLVNSIENNLKFCKRYFSITLQTEFAVPL